jgi:hypothetical protein
MYPRTQSLQQVSESFSFLTLKVKETVQGIILLKKNPPHLLKMTCLKHFDILSGSISVPTMPTFKLHVPDISVEKEELGTAWAICLPSVFFH